MTITAVLTARDFTEEELADYITITNKDIGAAASIKNTNSSFTNYKIVTENETSSVVYQFVYAKGEKPLYIDDSYPFFSLLNIFGNAKGIEVKNAKYPLENAEITTDYQYGISNEVIKGLTASVSVAQGRLLLIKVK